MTKCVLSTHPFLLSEHLPRPSPPTDCCVSSHLPSSTAPGQDNIQIMRDLAQLQLRLHQYQGWTETSRKLLLAETHNKSNWASYAVGSYLTKNYAQALTLLESYIKNLLESGEWKPSFMASEILLFYNQILEESGEHKKALQHLEANAKLISDPIAVQEIQSRLYSKLGDQGRTVKAWEALIEFVPENHEYHFGLWRALGLERKDGQAYTPAQVSQLAALYRKLRTKYPKAHAVQRLPLDFLSGGEFQAALKKYIVRRVNNPSLFQDIHRLYEDADKREVLSKLVLDVYQELEAHGRLFPEDPEDSQPPSVLMWILYYLGQHFLLLGEFANALKAINRALAHTPTNVDLYLLKARVYKRAGDYDTAFELMNTARELDTADRYLNTKCTRYALRSDRTERALEIVGLFLQEGAEKGLYDNQCSWFWSLAGDSYLRQGRLGMAIKNYKFTLEHFDQYLDDPSEFHAFCGRKGYLRAWVEMIRWSETAKDHKLFIQAASGVLEAYMELHDRQQRVKAEADAGQEQEGEEAEEDEKALEHEKTEAPLEEAAKHLEDLLANCPGYKDGLSLAVRLHSKMGDLEKASRSLRALLDVPEAERPASCAAAILGFHAALQRTPEPPAAASELVSQHPVLQAKTLAEVVEQHKTFLGPDSENSQNSISWCQHLARELFRQGEAGLALDVVSQSTGRIQDAHWSEAAEVREVLLRIQDSSEELKNKAGQVLSVWDHTLMKTWVFFRPNSFKANQ